MTPPEHRLNAQDQQNPDVVRHFQSITANGIAPAPPLPPRPRGPRRLI